MKHTKLNLIGVAAIALATITISSVFTNTATAQTNSALAGSALTNAATAQTNAAPSIADGLAEIYDALATSGLTTATNYAAEPYLTYAPHAPSGNQVGGGALLIYNVNSFVGTGLGVDYLGQFSLVSANLTLRAPTHPFAFTGVSWATNIAVVPFALAGVGTPLSGSGSGAIAVTDAGAYVSFGHLWGGRFNTGACYGRWDNAGSFTGPRYHFFVGWSKGF
jgi:hypothetical protein